MSKTNANIFGTWFVVRSTVLVDRPELRNSSFPVVPAGKVLASDSLYDTRRGALAYYEAILAGEFDYGSEFVRTVQVLQMFPNRSPRTVRVRVERERIEGTEAARRVA